MGMTIDEALNLLNNSKPKSNNAFSIQMNEAINVIGVTMRKYQKIKEIMAKRPKDMISSNPTLRAISKVIEDGNDR